MGLYGFKKQFVPMILDGSKTHTIRATRKFEDSPGKTMHLYTGLRQKKGVARLLMRVPCVKVEPIEISLPFGEIEITLSMFTVKVSGQTLDSGEKDLLAWRDGFIPNFSVSNQPAAYGAFALMAEFWTKEHGKTNGGFPFVGKIYHWDFSKASV